MIKYYSKKIININYEERSGIVIKKDNVLAVYFCNKQFPIFLQDDLNTFHKGPGQTPRDYIKKLESIVFC